MTKTLYAHMNKILKRGAGGMDQGVGPEFKPQYHKKKILLAEGVMHLDDRVVERFGLCVVVWDRKGNGYWLF
jgi:hypothetical protein